MDIRGVNRIGMIEDQEARPFLRWAGGKTKLLPELLSRVPATFKTYYEPFLGGGALFFALQPKKAVLSDANPDLVRTYLAVRDDVEKVVYLLQEHARLHEKHGIDHYIAVRAVCSYSMEDFSCAARMIYLNKTCFNGLWRVNKSGQFNVPMGKFKNPPTICDEENLHACSRALSDVEICCSDFKASCEGIEREDFAYLDPPYVPLSKMSDFTSYTKEGFGSKDQETLAETVRKLDAQGAHFLLSNAGSPKVKELYTGFKIDEVFMRRNINSKANSRGHVVEYLVSSSRAK